GDPRNKRQQLRGRFQGPVASDQKRAQSEARQHRQDRDEGGEACDRLRRLPELRVSGRWNVDRPAGPFPPRPPPVGRLVGARPPHPPLRWRFAATSPSRGEVINTPPPLRGRSPTEGRRVGGARHHIPVTPPRSANWAGRSPDSGNVGEVAFQLPPESERV